MIVNIRINMITLMIFKCVNRVRGDLATEFTGCFSSPQGRSVSLMVTMIVNIYIITFRIFKCVNGVGKAIWPPSSRAASPQGRSVLRRRVSNFTKGNSAVIRFTALLFTFLDALASLNCFQVVTK